MHTTKPRPDRTTINIPTPTHRQARVLAALNEETMTDLVSRLINEEIDRRAVGQREDGR